MKLKVPAGAAPVAGVAAGAAAAPKSNFGRAVVAPKLKAGAAPVAGVAAGAAGAAAAPKSNLGRAAALPPKLNAGSGAPVGPVGPKLNG